MIEQTPAMLVDPKTAAKLLSVSARKLWGLTFEETPSLPHVKLGRLVRYSPDDLSRWIESQRKGGEQ
jgi:predicted DNA-binding transcriptional regulator AlpA